MAWHENMTLILRALINDLDSPPTYADERLEQLLVTAAQLIKREVDFDYTYTVDVEAVSIDPDPVSVTDDGFINLTCLKAACLILGAETKQLAAQSFRVEDGSAVIDVKDAYKASKELYDKFCDDFARAKTFYMAGNLNAIKAILTPTTVETNSTGIIFG